MQEEKLSYRLWLNVATEGNARLFQRVESVFPELEEAYALAAHGKREAFSMLTDQTAASLLKAAGVAPEAYLQMLTEYGCMAACPEDENYPTLLKEIAGPPPVLYYKGRLMAEPELPMGIVGARRCTEYGLSVARLFARELVENGAVIISGMADGIDSAAAWGALDCAGADYPTVAVLGCGIDRIYPAGNRRLYGCIAERGCVMTEFPPKTKPNAYNFPMRNRIISGMSKGLLVVEAALRSGTSITAGLALEQGRDVFAIPGRISDPMSAGTNGMILRGEAKPVLTTQDILCEYGIGYGTEAMVDTRMKVLRSELDDFENRVLDLLLKGDRNFDELCLELSMSAPLMGSILTGLEFMGAVEQLAGRSYRVNTLSAVIVDDRK